MLIDCDTCTVRGDACTDCVVTVLLGEPPGLLDVDPAEQRALRALADGGLIPPLRMAGGMAGDEADTPRRAAAG